MSKRVKIGCAGLPSRMSRSRVLEDLDILEEDALTREPVPGARAMRRWRAEAPEGASFALLAPSALLGRGPEAERALELVLTARESLDAEVVVVRPPTEFGPSQANRDRLADLFSGPLAHAQSGARPALIPTGVWESSTLIRLSEATGVHIAVDPLDGDPTGEMDALVEDQLRRGSAYMRLRKLGSSRRRFDAFELEALAELTEPLDRGWVVFAHPERVRDARAFRQLLQAD